MEKLIELANQYEREKEKSEWKDVDILIERERVNDDKHWIVNYDRTDQWEWDNLYDWMAIAYLISSSYWFIQWLVDNDKIDLWNKEYECYWNEMYKDRDTADGIIMELSISDSPIDDLISYLK